VHTAAGLLQRGEDGVLEAIERAAQQTAAQIGLAAVAGIVDWAGAHPRPEAAAPAPVTVGTPRSTARGWSLDAPRRSALCWAAFR
jgi:hypothetical protein